MAKRERPDTTERIEVQPRARADARRGVLTILHGPGAGALVAIGEEELSVGRTDDAKYVIADESLSRRHARFYRVLGAYFVDDLGSTNGTFVDGAEVREPTPLADGARVQLGKVTLRFSLRDEAELAAARKVYEATVRDPLTGVYNRHFLDERLLAELSFAKRHGTPLTVLFVDADRFKSINDTFGHAGGDAVLRAMAAFFVAAVRTEDIVARYGGEELVIVLRGIEPAQALGVAERLRAGVEALQVSHEQRVIRATVSIGIATQHKGRSFASVAELVGAADAALYRAKEEGRNRVRVA